MQPSAFASAARSLAARDWTWRDHPPFIGFLERTVSHSKRSHTLDNDSEEDPATASISTETLTCRQFIVYSPTFRVPTFYFTLHDSTGSPLSLNDIVTTTLFHRFALDGTELTTFAATLPGATFPLLSQGEHPALGTPCWFLHPCESAAAVDEIVEELGAKGDDEQWLRSWLVVVGTVLHVM